MSKPDDGKSPLYMGFDLSTQQLKAVLVSAPDLAVHYTAVFDFSSEAHGFPPELRKGVLTGANPEEGEVYAPVRLWLQAVDTVLHKLKIEQRVDMGRVRAISGAGQQHGSVYWSAEGVQMLACLDPKESLEEQLSSPASTSAPQQDGSAHRENSTANVSSGKSAFAWEYSPNWQDASTQRQCEAFDGFFANGDQDEGAKELALVTGSKAHHRFTGPQILRFREKHPEAYKNTARISLVSSFLASLFLGAVAPFDISDVCGMDLWHIKKGAWHEQLLSLTAGGTDTRDLRAKLGEVQEDAGASCGPVSKYYVQRYGFNPACAVLPFTGDNPSTILALPLQPHDAIVSLGTSTTFLMSTPHYKPDPSVHFMNHPTTPGLYMFMLCYKNGGLAREQVRDSLPASDSNDKSGDVWADFNKTAVEHAPLNTTDPKAPAKIGLYFPRPEIVPNVKAGFYRYTYDIHSKALKTDDKAWNLPEDDCRAILESQMLSLRLRSHEISAEPSPNPDHLPAQPRRVYLVGGGAKNPAIAKVAGEVLGGTEGVYRLDVGGIAGALGSAYKAVWASERQPKETFEDFVQERWQEDAFVEKVAEGYQKERWELYGHGVEGLRAVESNVLAHYAS